MHTLAYVALVSNFVFPVCCRRVWAVSNQDILFSFQQNVLFEHSNTHPLSTFSTPNAVVLHKYLCLILIVWLEIVSRHSLADMSQGQMVGKSHIATMRYRQNCVWY